MTRRAGKGMGAHPGIGCRLPSLIKISPSGGRRHNDVDDVDGVEVPSPGPALGKDGK